MKKKKIIIAVAVAAIAVAALCLVPTHLEVAVTADQLYQYEDVTPEDLSVEAKSLAGVTYHLTNYELTDADLNDEETIVSVKKAYLHTEITINPVLLKEIQTSYDEDKVYAGSDLDLSEIDVNFVYEDGTEIPHEEISVEGDPAYITGDDYTVEAKVDAESKNAQVLDADLTIPVIDIVSVEPKAKYDWYEEDEIEPVSYTLNFADGTQKEIDASDAKIVGENQIIQKGENTFTVSYHDLSYDFQVEGIERVLKTVETETTGDFYIDEPVPYDQVKFTLYFEDESVLETGEDDERITIEDGDRNLEYGDNVFHAKFKSQDFDFTIPAIEKDIKSVTPVVQEAYIGEPVLLSAIEVTYEDGTKIEKTDFTTDSEEILAKGTNTCTVSYHDNAYQVNVTADHYRPVTKAEINHSGEYLAEDELSVSEITVTYDNGNTETVPATAGTSEGSGATADQAVITSSLVLAQGENVLHFTYHEQDCTFTVIASPRTAARLAKRTYAAEYAASPYKYCSDNVFVTVSTGKTAFGSYFLTHVIISDASHIHSALSNNTFGGSREKTSTAAKRLGWIVGCNGSYFNYSDGTHALAGVFIKNGAVISGSRTNGYEICLKSDGTLFTPSSGVSASSLLNQGVVQTFGTYLPTLISGGVGQTDGTVGYIMPESLGNYEENGTGGMCQRFDLIYPRTVIGMVKPCEYYILTSATKSYDAGMTLWEARDILLARGCTYARPMDGGGSTSLVYKGTLLNSPAPKGIERAVADFLYFSE